jgi:hypothetical protein
LCSNLTAPATNFCIYGGAWFILYGSINWPYLSGPANPYGIPFYGIMPAWEY